MKVTKLRIGADEAGLVPAGQYFQRLAAALREANERQAGRARVVRLQSRAVSPRVDRSAPYV